MKKGILIGYILGIITIGTITILAATYKFKAEEVEYTPGDTNWSVGNAQEAMNELYTLYKIRKAGSSGIFSVSDNILATGYMKSTANDNNVIFGGYCWKVIRVTDDNEVRMLYNGLPQDGECNRTGTDTQIGTSKYSDNSTITNYSESTVKTVVDNWYNTNLATNFGDKISGIDLITREEASTVGGGYLVSGQQYWTRTPSGTNITSTGSCNVSTTQGRGCSISKSGTVSSSGIKIVDTSGNVVDNNNGTYSGTLEDSCTYCSMWWYQYTPGNASTCVINYNTKLSPDDRSSCNSWAGFNCSCCGYSTFSGTCEAINAGSSLAVRPVITLKSNASLQGGEGTTSNPYYMK